MANVSGIVNQFETCSEPLEQKVFVYNILRFLTKQFSIVVTTIEEAQDLSQFTLE